MEHLTSYSTIVKVNGSSFSDADRIISIDELKRILKHKGYNKLYESPDAFYECWGKDPDYELGESILFYFDPTGGFIRKHLNDEVSPLSR